MYYIYLDESDKKGEFYSNFYGGIIMSSKHHDSVVRRLSELVAELGLTDEEIKWQKVNKFTFAKYIRIVDELFDILASGKAKIRIFFSRNTDNTTPHHEDYQFTYTKLYYQFIKNSFGFQYAPRGMNRVKLVFDEMPIKDSQKSDFIRFLVGLSFMEDFRKAGIIIRKEMIIEVDSKRFLPLQVLDLILGAICFRLNNKHKQLNPDGKRGNRTILKEKLYNHIHEHISRLLSRNFIIGVSTGIKYKREHWSLPYAHWCFKSKKL